METKSVEVCKLCLKSMTDPRILPCSDSFCLKCLETSVVSNHSSRCPTCLIEFQIPQGGLKDLKKNEFIEQLTNIKQKHVTCDSCQLNQAMKSCVECSFNYCLTCLEYHGRIPITSKHQLEPPSLKINLCKKHSAMKNVFCESCDVLSCNHCFWLEHEGHTMKDISEYFDSVKVTLEQNLKVKEEMIAQIHSTVNIIIGKRSDDVLRVSNLKKEIQQRGNKLKNIIDSIVLESEKTVEEEFDRQFKESGDVLNELKSLEKNLKAQVEAIQEQLNTMTHENVPTVSPPVTKKDEHIPQYSGNFDVTLQFHVIEQLQLKLAKIFGDVVKVQKVSLVKNVEFGERIESFASSKSGVYVCIKDGSKLEIEKVFPYIEWKDDLRRRSIINLLRDIHDLLIFDDKLFVSGNIDQDTDGIVQASIGSRSDPVLIYRTKKNGCLKMSKFDDKEFLVISGDRVLHFSIFPEPLQGHKNILFRQRFGGNFSSGKAIGGNLLLMQGLAENVSFGQGFVENRCKKEVKLPFRISDALHLSDYNFAVVSSGKISILNEKQEQLLTFVPYDGLLMNEINILTKDNHGNIYAYSTSGKVLILDLNLRLKEVCNIESNLTKICFYEDKNCFMALKPSNRLLTYNF